MLTSNFTSKLCGGVGGRRGILTSHSLIMPMSGCVLERGPKSRHMATGLDFTKKRAVYLGWEEKNEYEYKTTGKRRLTLYKLHMAQLNTQTLEPRTWKLEGGELIIWQGTKAMSRFVRQAVWR